MPKNGKKTDTKKNITKKGSKKAVAKKSAAKSAVKNTASKKSVVKKSTIKKKSNTSKADKSNVDLNISSEERQHMIAEAAYRRAEKRGFITGGENQDWFDAEKEIDAMLIGKNKTSGSLPF